jgi:hypothetical protein
MTAWMPIKGTKMIDLKMKMKMKMKIVEMGCPQDSLMNKG